MAPATQVEQLNSNIFVITGSEPQPTVKQLRSSMDWQEAFERMSDPWVVGQLGIKFERRLSVWDVAAVILVDPYEEPMGIVQLKTGHYLMLDTGDFLVHWWTLEGERSSVARDLDELVLDGLSDCQRQQLNIELVPHIQAIRALRGDPRPPWHIPGWGP